jgi:DNA-binding GntR family transcriptional regulator
MLRKAILSGAFAGGDHLVESRLAAQLGVSRAPVREAMFQLEREGLLQFDEGGAALVKELKRADMEEIFALRSRWR